MPKIAPMTSIERMQNTLERKPVDRTPIAVSPWGATVARWRKEGHIDEGEDLQEHFGQDLRTGGWLNSTAKLDFEPVVLDETEETRLTLDGNGAMDATGPVSMSVIASPSSRPKGFDTGISCQVSSWTRINDNILPPRIKCTANYMNGRLALMQAKQDGYDNALLLNQGSCVAEAPGACLFLVKDGVPVTPSVTSDILESITRRKMIELLSEYLGVATVERGVHRTELYTADEAFLCGTAAEITPITSVDRLAVGAGVPGPMTRRLQQLLLGIATGDLADHPEWRTVV